ncbi:MAG: hypothetical protein ABJB85_04755 [Nitrososphaerota archaeon]
MVDITNLANMFSQKTGAQSSMATMVINEVIGYMMQRGLGGMMSGSGGGQGGGIMSALSNFMGSVNTSPNSDMVKHVQQTCGIQDPQQASQYTQEVVNVMNEHGNSNPSGIESLFSNFMGGGQSQPSSTGQQQPQKKKGLLDDVMGSLGV